MTRWQEFAWQVDEPDASADRLCTPGRGPTELQCAIEGADFTSRPAIPADEVVICAYNVERGLRLDEQLAAIVDGAGMPVPDVLLLSEADRGCTRSEGRNVAREYARALGMFYVYGVEFVELPRWWGPGGGRIRGRCEHGNAIVSRYPLGNVTLTRHRTTRSWHSWTQRLLGVGQPRLGGRVSLGADIRIGQRYLRVYSVHFESGRLRIGRRNRSAYRVDQVCELLEQVADVPHGVVIGGDMNVVGYLTSRNGAEEIEPTTKALLDADFVDAHTALAHDRRITSNSGEIIDLLFGRKTQFSAAGVGHRDIWGGLSDHLPVWTRLSLTASPD